MRVSIIIPTFNRAVYLEGAISSALAQTYPDLEVLIADNDSSDNTQQVSQVYLRDPRVKYFKNPENIGMVRNWRRAAFELATGDWFLILSDDDILTNPDFITQAVQIIKSQKNVTVVYSSSYVYDEALNTLTKLTLPFTKVEDGLRIFARRGTVYPQDFALCNVLFNKKLAVEVGAFSNANNLSCDTELFLRLCLRGRVGVIHDYSSIYRVHSDNLLKSVNKNTALVIGSLDSLLKPLLEARKKGVNEEVLKEFVQNSGLKREILVCFLKTSLIDKEQTKKLNQELQQLLAGKDYNVLPSKFVFFLLISLSRSLVPLFILRRRLLYMQNTLRRFLFGNQVYFEPLNKSVYIIN